MMTQTQPTFGSQAIMQISQFMGMEVQEVREMVGAAETKALNEDREITIAFEDGNKVAYFSVKLLDPETFETLYNVTLIETEQVETAVEAVEAVEEVEEVQEDKWENDRYESYASIEHISRRTGKARKEWHFTGWAKLPSENDPSVKSMKVKKTKTAKWLMVAYHNDLIPDERFLLESYE